MTDDIRKILAFLLVGLTIGLGGSMAVANSSSAPAVLMDDGDVARASCVIRFEHPDGKTPTLRGGSHACVGVRSVRIDPDNGMLQIFLDIRDPHAWKVTAPFVLPDEQLAAIVTTGGSGGTDDLHVTFNRLSDGKRLDLRKAEDRALIWGKNRNIWYWSEWLRTGTFQNGGQSR